MDFEYVVEKWDTLQSIANKFNIKIEDILKENNIQNELPKTLCIPTTKQKEYGVLYNCKREYLCLANNKNVKEKMNKLGLYSKDDTPICLYKPKDDSVYVVGVLDTLKSISSKYGIAVEDIKIINNLNTEKLFIGQILKLCK